MINFLKVLFSIVFVFMCYEVIDTSFHSNLFTEWDFLGGIPWMRATLWDFYANVLAIFCWVCYKEKSFALRILWLILLITLGSIATSLYILIGLFTLKPGETIKDLLIKQS
ncbi:MAG: DUF1475 family protein [Bacteroidia bacterium]|nr:DUF1475 family protein [Bacteroidia bacterium]